MKFVKISASESIIECESIDAEIAALIETYTAEDAAAGTNATYEVWSGDVYYVNRDVPGETGMTIAMYYADTEKGREALADYREMVLRAARWERYEYTPEELAEDLDVIEEIIKDEA